MKNEPKKDDKQRIIAQQKGIKRNIVNRPDEADNPPKKGKIKQCRE